MKILRKTSSSYSSTHPDMGKKVAALETKPSEVNQLGQYIILEELTREH